MTGTEGAESARSARARLEAELERVFADDPPVTRDILAPGSGEAREVGRDRDPGAPSGSRETTATETPREGDAATSPASPEPVSRETEMARTGAPDEVSRETSRRGAVTRQLPVERGRPTRVLAIANQKGGVGKTTTAVNLAASLAAAERRTLLVDIDPQGNATSGVGVSKEGRLVSVYDLILDETPLEEAVVATDIPHLDLVPATVDLFGAEVELVNSIGREHRLRTALAPARDRYDFVLVDCPPSLGLLTVNALTAVDSVLIPIQCEYYALEGLSQLLGTIRIVQKNLNPTLAIEGVLLTMYDARLNLARQVEEEAVEYFGEKVYSTVIPRNVRLSEAPSFGKPVILYDVLSAGAVSYMKLAEELIERCRLSASASAKG